MAVGAFGLHPLDQIVNVQWRGKEICWIIGPRGDPTLIGQLMRLGDGSIPELGPVINLPFDTFSANCDIHNPADLPHGIPFETFTTITGNAVVLSYPSPVKIDWRGYAEMSLNKWDVTTAPNGQTSAKLTPSGKLFLDPAGKTIDKIPFDGAQKRGASIASDDEGTIYALGTGNSWILTKYDSDGNVLWKSTEKYTTFFNTSEQQIIATFVGSSVFFKDWYDLGGAIVKTVESPDDLSGEIFTPVTSKNGRIFVLHQVDSPDSTDDRFDSTNELIGYDINGEQKFKQPAPNAFDDSLNPYGVLPLGEKYFIVLKSSTKSSGNISEEGETQTVNTVIAIYDANTGEKVNEIAWNGTMTLFFRNQTTLPPGGYIEGTGPVFETNQRDASPLSFIQESFTQYYWPLSDWPKAPTAPDA